MTNIARVGVIEVLDCMVISDPFGQAYSQQSLRSRRRALRSISSIKEPSTFLLLRFHQSIKK